MNEYQFIESNAVEYAPYFADINKELEKKYGKLISSDDLAQHRTLLASFGLPITYQRDAWQKLAPLLALDKKSRGNTIRFVALQGIGTTTRLEDLTSAELDAAYERICS